MPRRQHNGHDHSELHIARGAQSVSERTGKRVRKTVENVVDKNQPDDKLFCFRRDRRMADNRRRNDKDQRVPQDGKHKCDFIQFLKIKICGVNIPCAHALPDDRCVDRCHGKPHDGGK